MLEWGIFYNSLKLNFINSSTHLTLCRNAIFAVSSLRSCNLLITPFTLHSDVIPSINSTPSHHILWQVWEWDRCRPSPRKIQMCAKVFEWRSNLHKYIRNPSKPLHEWSKSPFLSHFATSCQICPSEMRLSLFQNFRLFLANFQSAKVTENGILLRIQASSWHYRDGTACQIRTGEDRRQISAFSPGPRACVKFSTLHRPNSFMQMCVDFWGDFEYRS